MKILLAMGVAFAASAAAESITGDASCGSLLTHLDREFVAKNEAFENTLWSHYNNSERTSSRELHETEKAVLDYLGDAQNLARVKAELAKPTLDEFDRVGLDGYRRLFEASQLPHDEARKARDENLATEARFRDRRAKLKTGYHDPATGEFVPAQPKTLTDIVRKEPDAAKREAAYRGLQIHEREVLDIDYVSMIRQRNVFARSLGFSDYYEYKLRTFEGLSKKEVFAILDDLEARSREPARRVYDEFLAKAGAEGARPWNTTFLQTGDLQRRVAKYFPASEALLRWGRTFDSVGVDFRGARLKVDLLDRPTKYNNGFMRVPRPSFLSREGFVPAVGNFTATADLARPTAGRGFATTLHHEGGHAAHFGNSGMPGASYLTEFPPSSIALAELQAMFFDAFLDDPAWLARYAHSLDGELMPDELIVEMATETWRLRAFSIRSMMITPFLERALYELPDEELTADRVQKIAREIENRLVFQDADRPALTIPHTQSSESSGYYHAYVLAEVAADAVYAYFKKNYGYVVDNPYVANRLKRAFWEPGNSKTFLEMVKDFLGTDFSVDPVIAGLSRSEDEVRREALADIRAAYDMPIWTQPIALNLNIQMEHDGEVITSTDGGKSFEQMADEYAAWVLARTPPPAAAEPAVSLENPAAEPTEAAVETTPAAARPSRRSVLFGKLAKFVDEMRQRWAR